MKYPFWLVVAGILCLLLVLLVWNAQRILNTFVLEEAYRKAHPCALTLPARIVWFVVLWVGTAAAVDGFFLSLVAAFAQSSLVLTPSVFICLCSLGVSIGDLSILLAASSSREHWRSKQRDAIVHQGREQERNNAAIISAKQEEGTA